MRLGNVYSDFLQLANTQFIENRVYEEDTVENKDDSKTTDGAAQKGAKEPDTEVAVADRYRALVRRPE